MLCYEESIMENRTYYNDNNNYINDLQPHNPHIIENSYLEISKQKIVEDESLICNPQNEYLADNFGFCERDRLENNNDNETKEEVNISFYNNINIIYYSFSRLKCPILE